MIRARFPEWLWRGRAIAAARSRLAATEGARQARQRAQLALELAKHAEEPSEPFAPGPDPARARELYREASRWAQVALGAEPALAAEQASVGAFASALVEQASADEVALRRLRAQRRWRVGLCLGLLAVGAFRAALLLRDGIDFRQDLARGKPWQQSSLALSCDPQARRCGNHLGMTIFFHTAVEPSPWLVIDLEREQTVAGLRVRNRTDCCSELAIPLVVELSLDRQTWREVARRERHFRNWTPEFPPAQARWVRLRVDRTSALHLERVSVYR